MFNQNYLNELPDDIQDKIYTMVNKNKFKDCLCDIDNIQLKKFHLMYDLIEDDWFGISFDMDRCLNWKYYTTPKPEYQKIKCVRFGYCNENNQKFNRIQLTFINRHIKEHISSFDGEISVSKMTLKNNYIDVYFNHTYLAETGEVEETATDIIYKIYWGYRMIDECLKYTANNGADLHYAISWFDNHSFLECFHIKNGIVEPFFGS